MKSLKYVSRSQGFGQLKWEAEVDRPLPAVLQPEQAETRRLENENSVETSLIYVNILGKLAILPVPSPVMQRRRDT
jgi:hypothetical protein